MKGSLSLMEQMLFTTVRIETTYADGAAGVGTGCIFNYIIKSETDKEAKQYLFLVTNKHVIQNTIKGRLAFNLSDGKNPLLGNVHHLEFIGFEQHWTCHPVPDIDVAIMPIAPAINELSAKNTHVFFMTISQNLVPTPEKIEEEFDAVEDIVFIGYPNNIYDRRNLLPIVRKGITATPISIDFEGKPVFLMDASIFAGSSGSPVFICNKGSYTNKKGNVLKAGNRIFFLGIVSSVYVKRDVNAIEFVNVSKSRTPVSTSSQNIDLGMVYKAKVIIELIEQVLKAKEDM